jgi:hypothetical protein
LPHTPRWCSFFNFFFIFFVLRLATKTKPAPARPALPHTPHAAQPRRLRCEPVENKKSKNWGGKGVSMPHKPDV